MTRRRSHRRLRILVLLHEDLMPPPALEGYSDKEIAEWKTEYDVITCLEDLKHEVRPVGVHDNLGVLREALDEFSPHLVFNLLEEFHGVAAYHHFVVAYLELLRQPYTGCNPRGLLLARDKALSKKVLTYHRIPVPRFAVFLIGQRLAAPKRLRFPLIVKALAEQASLGISQASVVHSEEKLVERVGFMHERIGTDAIVEEYIEGRELYLGIMGNRRLQTFPVWEMSFGDLPEAAPRIATEKVKWDHAYQQRIGLRTHAVEGLPEGMEARIIRLCKKAYRTLGLSGYARMDLRLAPDGGIYLLEANPNPQISYGEDFADSAEHAGISYEALIQKIVSLGLQYRPMWREAPPPEGA
jgi:D-alanine-D-alanine ligase